MASTVLYPPVVESYTPAFVAANQNSYCRVYYSLSKFSSSVNNIKSIHFNIVKQSSGESVINKVNDEINKRYRTAGVLIVDTAAGGVINPVPGHSNLYYTDILASDIRNAWTVGWTYKIQIRFSNLGYSDYASQMGQAAWLNTYANEFSEWSTYTLTKAIAQPEITIPAFAYSNVNTNMMINANKEYSFFTSTLQLTGAYNNADASEILYSYRMKLKNVDGVVLEDTDILYANQYAPNQFYYVFKTEFDNEQRYSLELEYSTLNDYTETLVINFQVWLIKGEMNNIILITAEDELANNILSVNEDEECGRIGLKFYTEEPGPYYGNLCIRRSDSRTNFKVWEDIYITSVETPAAAAHFKEMKPFYDYTAESGVWYKYGLQFIDTEGYRSMLIEHEPIKREYAYSFLLGENNKQLRLIFANTVGSIKTNVGDSKLDTIGGQFPIINRNGNMKYKSFPLGGMISFNMDHDDLFTNLMDIYQYEEIAAMYKQGHDNMYDYTRERDFREKVLQFLQDGKPKLFKSPTEGNIIVRLMDVNTTPNQTLSRLVSSFTSTAYEIAEPEISNYLHYNFLTVDDYSTSLGATETRIGQLELTIGLNKNILTEISNKYNNPSIMGVQETVTSIGNITLEFESPATMVRTTSEGAGYAFSVNGSEIKLINNNFYDFGSDYTLNAQDTLCITQAGEEPVRIVLNFTYTVYITPLVESRIINRVITSNIGQFTKHAEPGEKIYEQIYYSYFYDWDTGFQELYDIKYATIEAEPGAVFSLLDEADTFIGAEQHVINDTGVLNLENVGSIKDIQYLGMLNENNELDDTISTDVVIDYYYYLVRGTVV